MRIETEGEGLADLAADDVMDAPTFRPLRVDSDRRSVIRSLLPGYGHHRNIDAVIGQRPHQGADCVGIERIRMAINVDDHVMVVEAVELVDNSRHSLGAGSGLIVVPDIVFVVDVAQEVCAKAAEFLLQLRRIAINHDRSNS